MQLVLQEALNGALLSVFYAVMAVGFTLIFGVMGIVNLAHGELYMVGAYIVWLTYAQGILPFPVAILAGAGIVAAIGIGMERALFRPMRGKVLMGAMLSVGMIFILQVFVATTWHVGLMKNIPPAIRGSVTILGAVAPWQRLIVIPAAIALIGGLWFFLRRTKQGQALRAVAQDPEAATLQGISIDRVGIIAMAIAAGLAGAAGGLMSPIMRVDPYMGHTALIMALFVTIVGGLGSIEGAVVASFIYGFMIAFITAYFPPAICSPETMAIIASALFMFTVLAIRPRGILSRG
jgi:branched-chain amino acid transport system permease protein